MRLSSTTSLALVGLVGSTLAHDSPVMRRKTMGFGPVHPHAKFHTSPVSSASASFFTSDPYDVARSFVTALLEDQLSGDNSFALRKDSYTDKATGVTHVFFRQMINGLEVADGDININVKDGTVISYGDSVSEYCNRISAGMALILPSPVLPWQCAQHLPYRGVGHPRPSCRVLRHFAGSSG